MDQSFIEVQFPVSKVSKESYKERKANLGQTITGLGKWWGRKPLILVRATILGLLMPASSDPVKDREIFLKILMMDQEGLWKRKIKTINDITIIENLTLKELKEYFEVPIDLFMDQVMDQNQLIKKAFKTDLSLLKWKNGISKIIKEKAAKLAFSRLSYDEKLEHSLRPEEVHLKDSEGWEQINSHLKTNASSLTKLINELGARKFSHKPIIGDSFCGGGSIPFEAARIGCDVFASDLNPIAGLLTWADLNIAGARNEKIEEIRVFQRNVYDVVDRQIVEWGIETNEKGHRANTYLYCAETKCLEENCGYNIPLSPSWIIGKGTRTVAILKDNWRDGFDIEIKSNASNDEIQSAEEMATIRKGSVYCPHCKKSNPILRVRRDRKNKPGETTYGLRLWQKDEFLPHSNDTFTDRLYCIRYEYEKEYLTSNKELKVKTIRYYAAPDLRDMEREEMVSNLLSDRFSAWQSKGYLPSMAIEPGEKTDEPIRTRGWAYWHQLFYPRQLLVHGLFSETLAKLAKNKNELVAGLLGINKLSNWNSKLSQWLSDGSNEKGAQTFYNQALNTFYNGLSRTISTIDTTWFYNINNEPIESDSVITIADARSLTHKCDLWITDPPYADAVNYHELSEFFLAWDKEFIKKAFPEWYTDSKRVLAVKGEGESFNKSMVEIYSNLTSQMPDNGLQVVMFTHQSPAVWADLTLILWSAGLHVTAAWNIATETESGGLKEGNYVKGTVIMVLRKLTSNVTAFSDTITYEIQEEVKHQIDSMRNLEDREDPNFSDADYILAAYAATLKVLTGYKKIGDINIEYELTKTRDGKSINPVEAIINTAIRTAYDYLIPQSFDSFIWKSLSPEERFFIKGMELEKSNVCQLGAYQEMARGFGVKDFKDMLASTRANQVRFKTPSEFGNRWLRGADTFGNTLLRQVIMAIGQSEKEENGQAGRAWLKNEVENYWDKRQVILELLRYLATTEHIDHMEHWENSARYARYLHELVSNDGT